MGNAVGKHGEPRLRESETQGSCRRPNAIAMPRGRAKRATSSSALSLACFLSPATLAAAATARISHICRGFQNISQACLSTGHGNELLRPSDQIEALRYKQQ